MRIVKSVVTAPDPTHPSGQKVTHVIERMIYTPDEVALLKSRWAFKQASLAATALLQATMMMVEKGEMVTVDGKAVPVDAVAAGAVAKELARRVGYMAVRPLVKSGLFHNGLGEIVVRSVPAQDDPDDQGDVTDAGNPPRKSAHGQPGSEPMPHLDADRAKKIPNVLTPATIDSGVSKIAKTLSERGWEPIESADEFAHFVKADVGEVILAPDGFALKSKWDGNVVMGESVPDLITALDAVE